MPKRRSGMQNSQTQAFTSGTMNGQTGADQRYENAVEPTHNGNFAWNGQPIPSYQSYNQGGSQMGQSGSGFATANSSQQYGQQRYQQRQPSYSTGNMQQSQWQPQVQQSQTQLNPQQQYQQQQQPSYLTGSMQPSQWQPQVQQSQTQLNPQQQYQQQQQPSYSTGSMQQSQWQPQSQTQPSQWQPQSQTQQTQQSQWQPQSQQNQQRWSGQQLTQLQNQNQQQAMGSRGYGGAGMPAAGSSGDQNAPYGQRNTGINNADARNVGFQGGYTGYGANGQPLQYGTFMRDGTQYGKGPHTIDPNKAIISAVHYQDGGISAVRFQDGTTANIAQAIGMAEAGLIEDVNTGRNREGQKTLRSYPDGDPSNNLSNMPRF